MANIDDFLADLGPRLNNGCRLIVLCGAGLSIPAVPSAAKIVERLRSEHPNLRASSYAGAMRKAFPGRSGRMKRRAFLDHLMVEAQPLAAHNHLADLMVSGVVDGTLTTNFDQLLETALFLRSQHRVVVYVDGEALATAEHLPGGHTIAKLHGDIAFEHTANTRPEMDARLDENFRTQLLKLLRGAALLVIGYGGGDRNVMRFLEDAASDPDCLGGGLWWWEYKSTKRPRASIRRVLDIARRQGKRAERFGSGPGEFLLEQLCKAYGAFQHPEAPFGVLKSNLPFYERLPRHATQRLQYIPLDSALKEATDLDVLVQELESKLRQHHLVFYVDNDPLRRKRVLAQWRSKAARPTVYHSERLTAVPSRSMLWENLRVFTRRLLGEEHTLREDVDALLRAFQEHNAVVVLDDIDSRCFSEVQGYGGAINSLIDTVASEDKARMVVATSKLPSTGVLNWFSPLWPSLSRDLWSVVTAPEAKDEVIARWRSARDELLTFCDVSRIDALPFVRRLHTREVWIDLLGGKKCSVGLDILDKYRLLGWIGNRAVILIDMPESLLETLKFDGLNNALRQAGRTLNHRIQRSNPADPHQVMDACALLVRGGTIEEAIDIVSYVTPVFNAHRLHTSTFLRDRMVELCVRLQGYTSVLNLHRRRMLLGTLELLLNHPDLYLEGVDVTSLISTIAPHLQWRDQGEEELFLIDGLIQSQPHEAIKRVNQTWLRNWAINSGTECLELYFALATWARTQLASILLSQGDTETPRILLDELTKLQEQIHSWGLHKLADDVLDNMANLYRQLGDSDKVHELRPTVQGEFLENAGYSIERAKYLANAAINVVAADIGLSQTLMTSSCRHFNDMGDAQGLVKNLEFIKIILTRPPFATELETIKRIELEITFLSGQRSPRSAP